MLKVYICEDSKDQRTRFESDLTDILKEEFSDMISLGLSSGNPDDILDAIRADNTLGIFFLDIDLSARINGIQLASEIRKIQPRCYIIFVTTHSEMSYMTFSYKVEAMDFIIKDNAADVKHRVRQCLLNCYHLSNHFVESVNKNYMVKIGSCVKAVPYDDILFFEASENARKVILKAKNSQFEFTGKLKDIESELGDKLYRCHRSFLVNRENVINVDKENSEVVLDGGIVCPMSVRLGKGLY